MEITFSNLDKEYSKGKREYIGDIQPKFWYIKKIPGSGKVLVKRQHSESTGANKPKSKMFNHIGEYFGYQIAKKADIKSCPVDLVTLHDRKNRFSEKMLFYTACASHFLKNNGTYILPGEAVILDFCSDRSEEYKKTLAGFFSNEENTSYMPEYLEDNVDCVIASIVNETIKVEESMAKRKKEQITEDCSENISNAIDMIVYDCIFGNHDRHSGNWSMEIDPDNGRVTLYPLYDNEAVLGLRKTEAEVENILSSNNVDKEIEEKIFSRMGYGNKRSEISYKDMLEHLVKKYPEYAIPSIKKITSKVDEKFINELYDGVRGISTRGESAEELNYSDELPETYRQLGMRMFSNRRNYALDLLKRTKFSKRAHNEKAETNKRKNEELELV